MEDKEKKTTEKVVEFIFNAIILLSGIVSIYALIWARWAVLQVTLSVLVTGVIAEALGITEHFKKGKQ